MRLPPATRPARSLTKPEKRLVKAPIEFWHAAGDNPVLRDWLDDQDLNYVMAVSCDARFATPTGPRRADELAACAPQRGWQWLSWDLAWPGMVPVGGLSGIL